MTKPAGQRAISGDRLHDVVTASRWNSLMDMLDAWQRSRGVFSVTPGEDVTSSCEIEVQNSTGTDLDRWACVGLSDVTVAPSDNEDEFIERHVVTATTPASTHATKFAILQEAIPDGEIGRAVVCGKTIATVNVSDTAHKYASPEAGEHRLQSGETGLARILYVETTGEQNALVVIGAGAGTVIEDGTGAGSAYSYLGCNNSRCIDADSTWATDGPDGSACPRVPRVWELAFPGAENPASCRLFHSPIASLPDIQWYYRGHLMRETEAGSGVWESQVIGCDCPDNEDPGACGQALWEWGDAPCSGFSATYRWTPGSGWGLVGDSACPEGCTSGAPTEPPANPDVETTQEMPCSGGTSTESGWTQVSGCQCGTAPAPVFDGSYDGQLVYTDCDSTGYEQPTGEYKWRFVEATWTLQLIELPGRVVYEWAVPSPKSRCCLCTNTLVLKSCPKPRECIQPPQVACINPAWVELCPDWGDAVEVDVGGFGGVWDDAGPELQCPDLDGLYLATGARPVDCFGGTCLAWHDQDEMMFGAPVDLDLTQCSFVSAMKDAAGTGGVWRVQVLVTFSSSGGSRTADVSLRAALYTGSNAGTDYEFFVEHQYAASGYGPDVTEVTATYTGTRGVGGTLSPCPTAPSSITVRRSD